jgi:hypothetical protein
MSESAEKLDRSVQTMHPSPALLPGARYDWAEPALRFVGRADVMSAGWLRQMSARGEGGKAT